MRCRIAVAALVVVAIAGCAKKPDKQARCQRVMSQMAIGLVVGVSSALGDADDPRATCLARNARDPSLCLTAEEAAAYRAALAVEVDKCMGWTDHQIGCFERFDDSPACEGAFAAMAGLQVSAVKAAGPAPAWRLDLELPVGDNGQPREIGALHAAGDAVIASAGETVIAVAGGAERWRATVPGIGLVAVGACVAVAGDDGVRCFDPVSGEERWRTRPPAPEEPALAVMAWRGDRLLLISARGTVAVADPAACKVDPAGAACLVARPPLDGAYDGWSMTRGVAVRPDGGWYYADDQLVAVVGPDDAVIARFSVRGGEGYVTDPAVTPAGAGLVGWEQAIHRIDPAACAGTTEVISAAAAPAGCVTVIASRGDEPGDGWAPRPLGEDGVAFTVGNELHVWRGGKQAWAGEISFGLSLVGGDPVIFTGGAELGGMDLPPEVRAVSLADGSTAWRTSLPGLGHTGLSGPLFTGSEHWLYIASRTAVAAVPRRAAP